LGALILNSGQIGADRCGVILRFVAMNGELSWVRAFSFSTIAGGGWSATAKTETGPVSATGRTVEEATEVLHQLLRFGFPEACRPRSGRAP
jgi:hypothetical protein